MYYSELFAAAMQDKQKESHYVAMPADGLFANLLTAEIMFSCIFLQLRKPNSAHKDRLCTISSGM
jgi:hypothetical protein